MTTARARLRSRVRDEMSASQFPAVLEAAKEGANWAWRRLVETYSGPLLGYVRMRGAGEPEDVLSEVWMAAATSLQGFAGEERSFRSWLFVIAHRRAIDARRKSTRRPSYPEVHDSLERHLSQRVSSAEDQALGAISSEGVAEMLSHLTADQRDVVALRVIAGFNLEETARVVGKRIGAVKALQRRGLETLRRHLDKTGVSP